MPLATWFNESIEKVRAYCTRPHRQYAASILRVGLGTIVFLLYAMHFHERAFLWGPHGQIDWAFYHGSGTADPISLYLLNSSVAWSESLYWAGLTVSAAFVLGVYPRLTAIVFYLLARSTFDRNFLALDGGYNLLGLLSFYLLFADSGRHLMWLRLGAPSVVRKLGERLQPTLDIVHNAAMALIAGQICMLYFWSGFYKVTGHKWQDGTAIYYVMRAFEFSLPSLSHYIYLSAGLVALLTYSTVVFQMSFPFLMWNKRLKPIMFVAAFGFHMGIAVFMGLTMFSVTMIVADLSIFSDGFFERIRAFISERTNERAGLALAAEPSA